MEDLTGQVKDHEGRIRTLEKNETITSTQLRITNKILAAIAIMIGGSLITYLFKLFPIGG